MLGILGVIVVGGIVGWLASIITGSDKRHGLLSNILVGIVGSFLAGLVSYLLIGRDVAELGTFTWSAFFWSLAGAVVLLVVWDALRTDDKRVR